MTRRPYVRLTTTVGTSAANTAQTVTTPLGNVRRLLFVSIVNDTLNTWIANGAIIDSLVPFRSSFPKDQFH